MSYEKSCILNIYSNTTDHQLDLNYIIGLKDSFFKPENINLISFMNIRYLAEFSILNLATSKEVNTP